MRHGRGQSRGFTLVELMVVIAAILILLGILLPSLSAARERGRAVRCVNNLHQWGVAVGLYLQDYGDLLPGEGRVADVEESGSWFNALPPYVQAKPYKDVYAGNNARVAAGFPAPTATSGYKDNWIWYCPTRMANKGKNTQSSNLNSFHYTFNGVLDGTGAFGGDAPTPTYVRFGKLTEPSATVLLFECTDVQPNYPPSNNKPPPNLSVYVDKRHGWPGNAANMLMADQHVETVGVNDGMAVPVLTKGVYVSPGATRLVWGKFR